MLGISAKYRACPLEQEADGRWVAEVPELPGLLCGRQRPADASFAGVHAGTDLEAKDTLEKQYATSDANTLEIIRQCGALRASAPSAGASPSAATGTRRFHYFYLADANQRRDWSLEGDKWTERYPDGRTTVFVVLGHITVDGDPGVELRHEPDDGDRFFVSDPGAPQMVLRYKPKDSAAWGIVGAMIDG